MSGGGPGVPPPLAFGGTGDDRFLLDETVNAGTRIDGGAGADRLVVIENATVDLRRARIESIEVLDFSSRFFSTDRGMLFSARQFGDGVATDVTVLGSMFTPSNNAEYVVVVGIGGAFSASAWQFQLWGTQKEFVDLRGSGGNDTITGSAIADLIAGNGGKDRLSGGSGNDTLTGGAGRDVLLGGQGNDSLAGGAGPDRRDGGQGDDTMAAGAGADRFVIRAGRDAVTDFDAASDRLLLDRGLWGGAALAVAEVLAYASVQGGATVFAFAAANALRLDGVTDIAGLAGAIDIL